PSSAASDVYKRQGMNLETAFKASIDGILITITTIFLTLIAGYFIGKKLGLNKVSTHLISTGTAICGGSAIAAVSPVIKADEKDISVSLAIVFLLNAAALFIFPPLGGFLEMTQHQFGLWAAIAIHDTSSVVGAAGIYGEESLLVASTVKLARALWIIPVVILTAYFFKSESKKIQIPWFIFYFIGAIILATYIPIITEAGQYLVKGSKALMSLTLFLIGSGLSIEKIKSVNPAVFILGIILWTLISTGSLIVILNYY
ncbi:MAG: putative sulfate exporter family transporter, partial [Ignavibacteriaceae bacterium]|nr:putative sulfate exporter family transporter [Ignavibacteriaceae bacterium]